MGGKRGGRGRSWIRILTGLGFAILSGCSDISENSGIPSGMAGAPLAVGEEALASLGVAEGNPAVEFHQVITPFVMADGSLVVPVMGAREIRVFDGDGGHLKTVGRTGEGPGEFAFLGGAWARADTIEAFDPQLRRITRFLPDGSVQVVPLQSSEFLAYALPDPHPEGWLVVGVIPAAPPGQDEWAVHLFGRDGSYREEITRTVGLMRYLHEGRPVAVPVSPQPVITSRNGTAYVASGLDGRIRVFDPGGTEVGEIQWASPSRMSAPRALEVAIDSAVARAAPDERAATRRQLEAAPEPERIPVLWHMIVDEEGFIWIRPYDVDVHAVPMGVSGRAGPGGVWAVLSSDGVEVGSVEMPPGLEPVQITSEAVIGIRRDDLGVESVRVHALQRR